MCATHKVFLRRDGKLQQTTAFTFRKLGLGGHVVVIVEDLEGEDARDAIAVSQSLYPRSDSFIQAIKSLRLTVDAERSPADAAYLDRLASEYPLDLRRRIQPSQAILSQVDQIKQNIH